MSELNKDIHDRVDRVCARVDWALGMLQERFGAPVTQSPPQSTYQYPPPPPTAFNPFPPGRGRRLMDAPDTGQVDEATFRRTTFEFGPPAPPEKRK